MNQAQKDKLEKGWFVYVELRHMEGRDGENAELKEGNIEGILLK